MQEQKKSKLFAYIPHLHVPVNVNQLHQSEISSTGFNQRIAVALTKATNNMVCAYVFACLAILGLPSLSSILGPAVAIYVVWFSQTFLQLIFLPILSVGQGVLNRHQELQSEEQFNTTEKTYNDIEQIMKHLDAQDQVILQILERLEGGGNNGQTNNTTQQP